MSNTLGAKVGERLAEIVLRASAVARERSTDHLVRTAMQAQEDFFRLTGSEIERTISPMWKQLADRPEAPPWFKDTALFVAEGKGQWKTLLAGAATGAVLGGGVMGFITNELAPLINNAIAANPHGIFTPGDAAQMAASGVIDLDWAFQDGESGGINRDRMTRLIDIHSQWLTPEWILALINRGIINDDFARKLFKRAGYRHDAVEFILKLRPMPLSAETAASMWTRDIVSTEEGVGIAAQTGVSAEDFRRLTELYGMPPAPEILYTAFRRGIINRERLQRGVVQGPIRKEWFDVLEAVQQHSMTPEQAASAVTQGHMTIDRGAAIAAEYGLDPDDFRTLIETAGLPPGVEFASEAFNRGFITDDEFGAMFLESRIKNRYLPLLRVMRNKLLPQETARMLLAKGLITREYCAAVLIGHGFSSEDAEALIAAASVEKTQAARDLSVSQTVALYGEREIDRGTAIEMLQELGYDEQEAEFLLVLQDITRLRTYRNAVITRIRSGFVAGLLDESETQQALDALRVPPDRVADLMALWGIERETVTRNLTPAQIVQAAKKVPAQMPFATAVSRLIGQGYAEADARILLAISGVNG